MMRDKKTKKMFVLVWLIDTVVMALILVGHHLVAGAATGDTTPLAEYLEPVVVESRTYSSNSINNGKQQESAAFDVGLFERRNARNTVVQSYLPASPSLVIHQRSVGKSRHSKMLLDQRKRDQAIQMLLDELPLLDIDGLNGGKRGESTANKHDNNQQQQDIMNNDMANVHWQMQLGANANGNRLRGRSTFLIPGNGGGSSGMSGSGAGSPGSSDQFQMTPVFGVDIGGGGGGGGGAVGNFPKRTPNRHVPCFFNAITCF